ncbi:MAG: histidine kinase [Mesorhizobium sp.]|nr:histidine kinase [Mesorhizobium sp.]
MPTLFRFLTIIAVLVGLAYGGMYALVLFVKPNKGEMTERIPVEKLNPQN